MRSYSALSDHDFEVLIADLIGADLGLRFEVFPRGADAGIDLRHVSPGCGPDIVQCKHYWKSSASQLVSDAKKEPPKLAELDPPPKSYRFATSQSLTAKGKRTLAAALAPWITSEAHILGADDLEALLRAHPAVERQHVKLWLTGGAHLDALVHAGTYSRSRQLLDETQAAIPRYVETRAFHSSRERL